jgi:hypothetical protein
MFEIVMMVTLQSVFFLKIYQIKKFYFLKIILTSTHQNNIKILKKNKILKNTVYIIFPNTVL